ncbi:MAG: cobalamin biosynthesis protein CobG [Rhodobacteraceae bacterium]|nr:cobalamin biosynthesis protein CobG [Paracoccaceae bacterium]
MSFTVKGWCPGALRPMLSGDGFVVRVRPVLAELTAAQVLGLCAAAETFGAGLIDITNRANLQIRGVTEAVLPALRAELGTLGLIDPDIETETRRNILVAPMWATGDDTHRLARELTARLGEFPALPPKVGFAVDAGPGPVLGAVPADFRIERGADRGLILRPDGRARGIALAPGAEIDTLIRLADWFVASGGAEAGRMVRHPAPLPDWAGDLRTPAVPRAQLRPGVHALGAVQGCAFGQVRARALVQAVGDSGAAAIRVTPWRALLLLDAAPGPREGLIWDADAPELRADACPGAPSCPQASVETRTLARRLAPHVAGHLHVSGCAKGCAHPAPADVVITGESGAYGVAFQARAGDPMTHRGLSADQVLARFGAA